MAQLEEWVGSIPARGDLVLTIRTRQDNQHVGNISLNSILWVHRTAELAIMIGAKEVWGRGYGTEAINLLTCHAFASMGMHRVWAESPNPAFNATMQKLGWRHEGTKREGFLIDGQHVDFQCWGLLEDEWKENRSFSA
jgi:RimJ/RimL family protein N-acetyltransferase